MAYDEALLLRVRTLVADIDFQERKMFGGVAFMFNGHMTFGLIGADIIVRVGRDAYEACLRQPQVTEMKFTGRAMRGIVTVLAAGIKTDKNLRKWIERGLAFTSTLEPK